ncbi:class I SAM-dependent methyltransferase [Thalassospira tepidiphila]|uniref:class I SAM-dependent methyltransferase n=1 Tax=Thalassospira tepidiphila TaxID=393657 RepID=UPI003AA98AC7
MTQNAQKTWDESFEEQIASFSYNTAPVEALARNVAYHLRARYDVEDFRNLHFLEMGCGGGINLIWAAQRGIRVSGVDISPVALELARRNLIKAGYQDRLGDLLLGNVCAPPFSDNSFDGVLESCVFQHLNKEERPKTFNEIHRILKPGGAFFGHMIGTGCTVYQSQKNKCAQDDSGTLNLQEEGGSKYHLQNIGLAHFYEKSELISLLSAFTNVDVSEIRYELPQEEAQRRGYDNYVQSMWSVYAIK